MRVCFAQKRFKLAIEWFYEQEGSRRGPVGSGALKRLAESGVITPDTRIWREGLSDWVSAKVIRGLFAANPVAAPVPVAEDPPPPASFAPPAPSALSPLLDVVRDGGHPFDLMITAARSAVSVEAISNFSRMSATVGVFAVYVAAGLVPLGGILLAARNNRLTPIGIALGVAIGLLVLQFCAQRLLGALDSAIAGNTIVLSSLAVIDCLFVLIVTATLSGTAWLLWLAASDGNARAAVAGVLTLGLGIFVAAVAVVPAGVGVVVDASCRAAEDAVGVATVVLKLMLRAVPIFFAMAVVVGTVKTLMLLWTILRGNSSPMEVMEDLTTTASLLIGGASLPLTAYAILLAYYLTFDLISAIVSIPAKLDRIAEVGSNDQTAA